MNIQDRVFRLSFTMLTFMPIPCQDIFPDIPKTKLISFLIFVTGDVRILDLLCIKLGNLDDDTGYRQGRTDVVDNTDMSINFVSHRRCYPSMMFAFYPVAKTRLPVSQPISSRSS